MIPLHKVFMSDDAGEKVSKTLQSGYIGQGEKVEEFEGVLKDEFGTPYVLTTNSCTSALHLAVMAANLQPGDEVISTPLTCFAMNSVLGRHDLNIKWCDVSPDDLCMDMADLERKISPNTKAIVLVRWGGSPVKQSHLEWIVSDVASANYGKGPAVIVDCAHAYGTPPVIKHGNHRWYSCYSFQAVKTLTTGDGGAIICPQQDYEYVKRLRWYGMDRDLPQWENRAVYGIGDKYHMNDIAATIGLANYPHAKGLIEQQRYNSWTLHSAICGLKRKDIGLLDFNHNDSSCYYFTVLVDGRDAFIKKLAEAGFEASPIHVRNDKQPCFKDFAIELPNLDSIQHRYVNIPCGWWMTDELCYKMVDVIKDGW